MADNEAGVSLEEFGRRMHDAALVGGQSFAAMTEAIARHGRAAQDAAMATCAHAEALELLPWVEGAPCAICARPIYEDTAPGLAFDWDGRFIHGPGSECYKAAWGR